MRISAVLVLLAASGVAAQELPQKTDSRIRSLVDPLIGEWTPGLALAVIDRGKVFHSGTYGVGDIANKTHINASTPFYIASLAKMFTALGIMQLVEQGRLTLDTPIQVVVPEVPAYAQAVTIAQLLNHTSGLIDHFDVEGEDRVYGRGDVLRILADAGKLKFEPGTKSSYSNSAYVLLAWVIERVSGQSYAAYVKQQLFDRAGMRDTHVAAVSLPKDRVHGYKRTPEGFVLSDYETGNAPGAGGMYASLEDLYRWVMALRAGRIVSAASLKLASTPTILRSGRDTEWGMGWLAESHGKKDPLAGHTYVAAVGSLRGFRALLKWYQQGDLIVIWMANSNADEVFDVLGEIPHIILPDPTRPMGARSMK